MVRLAKQPVLVGVVCLSLFGPYIIGGVRTDQLALYGYASALVLTAGFGAHLRMTSTSLGVLALWGALATVAILGAAFPPSTSLPPGELVAGLDNLLLPLACLVVGIQWARGGDESRRACLDTMAVVCVYALVANAVFALLATRGGFDVASIGQHFWGAEATGRSVAERAATSGRLGGIFNQPAEAGIAYSLGIQLALWRPAWREQRPRRLVLILAVLVVGGLLSISKIFVFAGIGLLFAQLLASRQRGRGRQVVVLAGVGMLALGSLLTNVVHWEGRERLISTVTNQSDQSLLHQLTAGRAGEESTLLPVAQTALKEQPVLGYGAQGLEVAYDSTFIEMLLVGGLLAVALHTAVFAVIVWQWRRLRRVQAPDERRLAVGVLVVTLVGSFGLPATTANRVGPLVWLLLGLLVIHVAQPTHPWLAAKRADLAVPLIA